jgi:hypothetical protein
MLRSLLDSIVGALNNPHGEEARKIGAWVKTTSPTLPHNLPNPEFRLDPDGIPIRWSDYGDKESPYGWYIDQTDALAGGDDLGSLRACHWRANGRDGGGPGRSPSELEEPLVRT